MIRKIVLKAIVFVAIVIGTAFLINKLNNANFENISREMEEPTLPVVYCEYNGQAINRMRGYTQIMSTGLMRENIIPISEDGSVMMLVRDDDSFGATYSYELRSISGDSLIEDGALERTSYNNTYDKYQVTFRMDMNENQEYVLVFIITNETGEKVRYYTRVVRLSEEYAIKVLQFAQEFHNTCFEEEAPHDDSNVVWKSLSKKAETGSKGMAHVNLDSPYEMVTWGDMKPIIVTGIVPSITELDSNFAVVHYYYVAETFEGTVSHYYNVDEYYSATYDKNTGSVKLLAFDRQIESIFDEKSISKNRNSISLGISDIDNGQFMASEDQKKIAFVKEGQLYEYNYSNSNLVTVFSFVQNDYLNERALNTNIDVNIVNIDEDGNIYFVVYGYMNRGKHEGENGVSLFYFSVDNFDIEEKFFVQSDEPFEVMKQEVGRFAYYDEEGLVYYLLGNAIYEVDLNNMTQTVMVEGIPSASFLVSENKNILAYPNAPKPEDVTTIHIHNFETGEEYVQSGGENDRFLALGFVGNDIIYGKAEAQDIAIATTGEATMPLYELYIMSPQGDILKEYSKSGIYIINADVQEEKIYLKRATKQNQFFAETDADYITFKPEQNKTEVVMQYAYTPDSRKVLDLTLPNTMYISEAVNPVITKHKFEDTFVELSVKTTPTEHAFYVFDNSGYLGEYGSAGKAIMEVCELGTGLVINSGGNTIYRTLEAAEYNTVASSIDEYSCESVEATKMTCAYMCAHYLDKTIGYDDVMRYESWEDLFADYYLGIAVDISGVDLNTALYFLDRDIPFAAKVGTDGRFVLVVSYNATHIRYYDPMEDEEIKVTRKEFEELLSMHGNTIYTYSLQ